MLCCRVLCAHSSASASTLVSLNVRRGYGRVITSLSASLMEDVPSVVHGHDYCLDRPLLEPLVKMAEQAGADALVLLAVVEAHVAQTVAIDRRHSAFEPQ